MSTGKQPRIGFPASSGPTVRAYSRLGFLLSVVGSGRRLDAASSVWRFPASAWASSRSAARVPPCHALREAVALPSALRGPVDRSHGHHCLIRAACRALRSGVQPFAMSVIQ